MKFLTINSNFEKERKKLSERFNVIPFGVYARRVPVECSMYNTSLYRRGPIHVYIYIFLYACIRLKKHPRVRY